MDRYYTMNKKIDSVINKLSICNSNELTKGFSEIELRCLIAALSSRLAAYNFFMGNMRLQHAEWVVAVGIVKELYEKHLEIGLYSDLNYLWGNVKKFLEEVKSIEERTSCAQDSATQDTAESAKNSIQQAECETASCP